MCHSFCFKAGQTLKENFKRMMIGTKCVTLLYATPSRGSNSDHNLDPNMKMIISTAVFIFLILPSDAIVQNYWEVILRHENVLLKLCTGPKPSNDVLEAYFSCQLHGETEIEKSYGQCLNSIIPSIDERYMFSCDVTLPDTHAKDNVTDTKIENCRKKECFENSTTDCLEIKIGLGVLSCQEKVLGIPPESAEYCKDLSKSFIKSEQVIDAFCEENVTISEQEMDNVHHCLPYTKSKVSSQLLQ